MSHFRPVRLEHASRPINHGPTVLVTSAHDTATRRCDSVWSCTCDTISPYCVKVTAT